MFEMKIPGNCGALLKSIASGIKLLSIKPICSCIDRSISINRGPSENSTVCITDTSYSIVSVQNGELCPHFKICCASASDLLLSEICGYTENSRQIWNWTCAKMQKKKTYIVNAQNSIARLDATRLVSGPKRSHWSHNYRHLWPTTKS